MGRPKTTWRRTVEKERKDLGGWQTWNVARTQASDRTKWKKSVEAFCARVHEEDR